MKIKLSLIIFSALALAACQKNELLPKIIVDEVCSIDSIVSQYDNPEKLLVTHTFTRDDKGRIIRADFKNSNNYSSYQTFTYEENRIVVGPAAQTIYVELDDYGRIIKDGPSNFKYNIEGYLVEERENEPSYSALKTFTYQSGTLLKVDNFVQWGDLRQYSESTTTYMEYTNEPFQSLSGMESPYVRLDMTRLYLWPYLGKSQKYMISKITIKKMGYPDHVTEFSYQKDHTGKIISYKQVQSNYPNLEMKFSYQCK